MKSIKVLQLGFENVELFVDKGTSGGRFRVSPLLTSKSKLPNIVIGIDAGISVVITTLAHEAFEFSATRMQCRYDPSLDVSLDNGSVFFAFNHSQFSQIIAGAAEFIYKATPLIIREWEKLHKKKVKK